MKLELATAHQILLELSKTDLLRFDLSVEQLLAPTAQTRAQLCALLSALAAETGCFRLETDAAPCAFLAREIDDLIDAARAVCVGKAPPRVTLLETGDGYLLLTERLHRRVQRILSEFLRPVYLSDGAHAVLRERSRVLLADAPISALCGGA